MPLRASSLLGVGLVGVVIAGPIIAAQAPEGTSAFDVVSVKPVNIPVPYPAGSTGFLPGGRYVVRNTNLLNLLAIAYRPSGPGSLGIDHIDASHAPAWVRSALFDIEARASSQPAGWGTDEADQLGLKLDLHREPTDVLVIDHIEKPTDD